jgi:hypothetical protein
MYFQHTDEEKGRLESTMHLVVDKGEECDGFLREKQDQYGSCEYDIYLGAVLEIALRMKGYEIEWCSEHCCGAPTDDSHIIVNW